MELKIDTSTLAKEMSALMQEELEEKCGKLISASAHDIKEDLRAKVEVSVNAAIRTLGERLAPPETDWGSTTNQELLAEAIVASPALGALKDAILDCATKAAIPISVVKRVIAGKLGASKLERAMGQYAGPGVTRRQGKKPIFAFGEKGSGKTYTATFGGAALYGEDNTHFVEFHKDFTPEQLWGFPCAEGDGTANLGWRDGVITQVFRAYHATKTKKHVPQLLILDEFLQAPSSTLNGFKSFLAGVGDEYVISTGRPIGPTGKPKKVEQLRMPIADLGIIATTNVGGRYDVVELDDAMMSRFHPVQVDCTPSDMRRILRPEIAAKGKAFKWTKDEEKWLLDILLQFAKKTKMKAKGHELNRYAGTRELLGIVHAMEEPYQLANCFDERHAMCARPYYVGVDDWGDANPDQKTVWLALAEFVANCAKAFATESRVVGDPDSEERCAEWQSAWKRCWNEDAYITETHE